MLEHTNLEDYEDPVLYDLENRCYGPDYLTTKRTEWMEKKERQKRPVKVSFSFTAYNCQQLDHQSI
jgi:hypothetical protein